MSQRRSFCIDATTMGLSTPGPPSPGESGQKATTGQQQQLPLQTLDLFQRESTITHQEQEQEAEAEAEAEGESSPVAEEADHQSVQRERQYSQLMGDMPTISKVLCGGEEQRSGIGPREALPTEHYRSQVERLQTIFGESAKLNSHLNRKFLQRLEEIDCMDAECGGDSHMASQLRLGTFGDWVDHLLDVNYMIFSNMSTMEIETFEKIVACFQSARGEQHQLQDENRKLRKDLCAIIKLVQQAYHCNVWNTEDLCLETLTVNQLLGLSANQSRPESETEKMAKCTKSLASEVAAKHDEICSLQSQMRFLDEVVQTARQKIILKDQCIALLNQQLMELQESRTQASEMRSAWAENRVESDCSNVYSSITICLLDDKEYQLEDLLCFVNIELSELMDLVRNKDLAAMQIKSKKLACLFEKTFKDRANALHKLEMLRNQLRALDCNADQLDAPTACSTQILEDVSDMHLIDAVRRRMKTINECNKELNGRCKNMESKHQVELLELRCSYESERNMNIKNEQVLKEIADLLSKLRGCQFSYKELYTEKNSDNPFIIAIMEMHEKLEELEKEQKHTISADNNESTTTAASRE